MLYEDILWQLWKDMSEEKKHDMTKKDVSQLFHLHCYSVLQSIRDILENDSLSDAECFERIEEIVTVFDAWGGCGYRHDFG